VVHVRHFPVDVVFYSALLDEILAAFVSGILLWAMPWLRMLDTFERLLLLVIWLLLGYSTAISVPTIIDRSLSFYLLEKLEQRGGGIRQDAFASVFVAEYLPEHRLVDVRLTEQLESGTVVIESGCVLLTPRGRRVAQFSRSFRQQFLPRQRLLMGEYTDALTDPFRGDHGATDYGCKPD
jgi:hypothetical protein